MYLFDMISINSSHRKTDTEIICRQSRTEVEE